MLCLNGRLFGVGGLKRGKESILCIVLHVAHPSTGAVCESYVYVCVRQKKRKLVVNGVCVYGDMVGSNYSIICCDVSFLMTGAKVQWGEWRLAT